MITSFRIFGIVLLCTILIGCMTSCKPAEFDSEYQLFRSIMDEIAAQETLHVLIQNDHIVNGVLEQGNSQEIWKCGEDYAMTSHISNEELNSLYFDGVFYVQQEVKGDYIKSIDDFIVPDLWAGVLDEATADKIINAAVEQTEFGSNFRLTILKEENDDAVISAVIAMDSDGNVIAIVSKAVWQVVQGDQIYAFEGVYTTQFLPFAYDDVAEIISERAEKISKQ